jgi:hypothetical protein
VKPSDRRSRSNRREQGNRLQFTVYDITRDENIPSRRWGTRQGIEGVRGVVLEHTAAKSKV